MNGTRSATGAGTPAGTGAPGGTRSDAAVPRLVHGARDTLAVVAAGTEILRYHYRPDLHPDECPVPWAHPLRSLAGRTVTGRHPHDHRRPGSGSGPAASPSPDHVPPGGGAHLAAALLPGSWSRPALGPAHRTEHTGFTALAAGGRTVFTATLDWYAADGRHRVTEARRWQVLDLEPEGGSWTLEFATELRNTAGEPLHFAGAAPFGRELPGHCGFFWRGPEGVAGGAVTQPAGSGPVEAGARAPWLAFTGEFGAEPAAEPAGPVPAVERVGTVLTGTAPSGAAPSGTELLGAEPAGREPDPAGRRGGQPAGRPGRHPVTLVFAADPRLPGGAPYWRVRHGRAPVVDPRPALERQPPLAPGATLRLAYRLVVADGRWDRERIAAHLADHPW